MFNYAAGDGNDKILYFRSNSTLSISGASYSSQKSGSNIIVTVGYGQITLVGAVNLSKVNIKGTKSGTSTGTGGGSSNPTPTTGSGGKNISNNTSYKIINGTSSADSIYNGYSGSKVTINAGAGNNTVSNRDDTVKIDLGAGNASLRGRAGNDTFVYKYGDGKD